tara:strand:- start:1246 stop:1581 length:336 start_codon:yes stop_codon:yes gene_type:complete
MSSKSLITKLRARRRRARPENRAKENAKRDYKKEYRRDQSSPARRKYRSDLNKFARSRGFYGNTPKNKDIVHKDGRIAGLGDRRANRADGASKAALARTRARRRRRAPRLS